VRDRGSCVLPGTPKTTEVNKMGASYSIICKYTDIEQSSFYITRNYNRVFPFWMLHNHIQGCYESDKRKPFISSEEHKFLLKTVRNTLKYYVKGNIYNYDYWEAKMKSTPEYKRQKGWETNKYTVVCALIRYYWHLKRFPFNRYKWSCWY